ncbi:MAG: AraC family transcriptional regulator [Caulobacteraceae bacterium]|nr:AraC family transcriptional regulator [Caulobacteraceae bacterium]
MNLSVIPREELREPGFSKISDAPYTLRCYTRRAIVETAAQSPVLPPASSRSLQIGANDGLPFSGTQEIQFFGENFGLILSDYVFREPFEYEFVYESWGFIQFQVTGSFGERRPQAERRSPAYRVRMAPVGHRELMHFGAERSHRTITAFFDAQVLQDLLTPDGYAADEAMASLLHWGDRFGSDAQPLFPGMQEALGAIMGCSFDGSIRRAFMKAKASELLCLIVSHLANAQPAARQSGLGRQDRARVRAAKDLLDQSFLAPPSLAALSRRVGLNRKKLTTGFKDLFGETVAQYCLKRRMEAARSMLAAGDMRVSDVAEACGYSDQASFSRTFSRIHGRPPRFYSNR